MMASRGERMMVQERMLCLVEEFFRTAMMATEAYWSEGAETGVVCSSGSSLRRTPIRCS